MTLLTPTLRTVPDLVGWRTAAAYAAVLVGSLPFWPFAWHLTLHVLGAGLLIGNAIVMAVWLTIAGFSRSEPAKRRAARAVNLGDVWFTVPGAVLLLTNGLAMVAERYGGLPAVTSTLWIGAGLVLLIVTGIVWAFRLVPAQLALYRLALVDGPLDVPAFRAILNRWYVWGTVATVMPILALVAMTTKPTL
jgi:uncharacterized membrane protein